MLFNVEADTGDLIIGYVVPDTYSGQATIAVLDGTRELFRLQTSESRPALVSAGRHETGLCGFRITQAELPDLTALAALELRDVETDVTIYRRVNPHAIVAKKLFRLDTHLLPLNRLDRALRHRFQFYFPSVERFGLESIQQMFLMNNTDSVLATGRVSYRGVEYYLDKGYESIVTLHNPYDELAERLLIMRLIDKGGANVLPMRDKIALEHTIAFAADLPLDSDKELKRAFRKLDIDVAATLSDPITRQIVGRSPDEILTVSSISAALSILSGFAVVGLRSRPHLFTEAVVEHLSLHEGELPVLERLPTVLALGERLRSLPVVERLIEHDLALYQLVLEAFEHSAREE